MEGGMVGQTYKTAFIPGTHPPGMTLPGTAWVWLGHVISMSDVFAPACTNEIWPLLRPLSVEKKNKLLTMSSNA